MNIILLSGGSGKRLWPLSNEVRSKQFIKIFKMDDGEYESMLQRVYRQICTVDSEAKVTIATSKSQVSSIYNQLGETVGISVEPCRRDTFPAIVLAACYARYKQNIELDETIVICPVDPYVSIEYYKKIKDLDRQVQTGEANMVLMGIEPSYPSEKYGYILPENDAEISSVKSFKEKPNEKKASEYISQGALWNAGVFAFKLSYILQKAHEMIDFVDYDDLLEKYEQLEKISFDYAIVEKESSIQVVRYSGEWKDLGTWNTLTEAMDEETIGNAIVSPSCNNVNVINELDIPIIVMGLDNAVVSASPDGILVTEKNESSYLKPLVDSLESKIMFAEKSWGDYRVLNVGDTSYTVKLSINKGKGMSYHCHERRDEIVVVLSGEGIITIDGIERDISSGDVIQLKAGCKHMIYAKEPLEMIEVQLGKDISVSDKRKF